MPERTREHEIGERALDAVRKTLSSKGFAIDDLRKDYGEDLLVQTSHEGQMDASRLWFQVKGTDDVARYRTSKRSKKERFSYPVRLDTAMRWIRTIDLVVVVLWDVERDAGWYAVPRRQVDDWQGRKTGQKNVTLHFGKSLETEPIPPSKGVFDPEAAYRLAWESRFEHFRMLSLSALNVWGERETSPSTEGEDMRKLALIMDEFLRLLDLTDREHDKPGELMINRETRERAVELYKALIYGELGEPPEDLGDQVRLVAAKVILERLEKIDPMLGMPAMLFGYAAHALALALGLARFFEEYPDAAKRPG